MTHIEHLKKAAELLEEADAMPPHFSESAVRLAKRANVHIKMARAIAKHGDPSRTHAPVAQGTERLASTQLVAGLNPARGTTSTSSSTVRAPVLYTGG